MASRDATCFHRKNKLVFVNGTLICLSPTDLLFSVWNRCNSMVISWILNFVTKDIADSLLYFSNAYEVWSDLKTRYSQANGPRIFHLKQQISSFCQGSSDVNGYYTKLKSLWNELLDYVPLPLSTCGVLRPINTHRDQDHILQFLIVLNDSYSSLHAQILLIDPLPLLGKVFSIIPQEERRRQSISLPGSAVPDSPFLNSVTTSSSSSLQVASSPPTVVATQRHSHLVCTYCHLSSHTREKCFKLNGYPLGYKSRPPRPTPFPTLAQIQAQDHSIHSDSPQPTHFSFTTQLSNPNFSPSDPPLAFTPSQYNQLLSLLDQSSASSSPSGVSSVVESPHSVASFSVKSFLSFPPSCSILDTGATHHVCI
ncbi:uncharacterized protein LOC133289010 [Gastrolobium bilobum]|uniref:uncharacterized protein LOC133289010 n=1 Tax=Gastrolobium bilobum TaxID=150636 RepID=UPI002AB27A83|nr:uncharacterized protein LOC133289010 [Gastrolobium bilobum]